MWSQRWLVFQMQTKDNATIWKYLALVIRPLLSRAAEDDSSTNTHKSENGLANQVTSMTIKKLKFWKRQVTPGCNCLSIISSDARMIKLSGRRSMRLNMWIWRDMIRHRLMIGWGRMGSCGASSTESSPTPKTTQVKALSSGSCEV